MFTHMFTSALKEKHKILIIHKKNSLFDWLSVFSINPLPFPYVIHILSSARDIVFHEHINNVLLTFCVMTGRMQVQNL